MRRRLGCLSAEGIITALVVLVIVGFVFAFTGGSLFSPGPLNAQTGPLTLGGVASHADIGGRCAACHAAPWSDARMADRCLACHTDVGDQLGDQSALHGALQVSGRSFDCRNCHPEHRGATGLLTLVDQDSFPHQAVGFSLEGHQQSAAGESFVCGDCHGDDLTTFDPAVCRSCHAELDSGLMADHTDAFGLGCLDCHDGVDTYGAAFDHNDLSFPLLGQHAGVACSDCHLGARSPADLQSAAGECYACHQQDDPHRGALGLQCDRCHTADGWEAVTFDHAATAFPLTGAHADVICEACHQDQTFVDTPTDCVSCHAADDAHDGHLGDACQVCHTAVSWDQATIDHSLTAFPLIGAHADVDCEACHEDQTFGGTPTDCYSCHAADDAHDGRLGQACEECHTPDDWAQASIDHSLTAFPLIGAHVDVDCEACHEDQIFRGTPTDCYSCHAADDVHDGRLGQACDRCHTPEDWSQASIDHSLTSFPLTGAHTQVACDGCHAGQTFAGTPQACVACHPDPAFHLGVLGTDCAACHTTAGWLPALFDRAHGFPINHGSPAASSCRTCHPERVSAYTCYGCHEHSPAAIQNEHLEEGISDFQDCVRCHPTGREEEGEGEDD